MELLEYLAVGVFYLPFLAIPFVILFWYAFAANRRPEQSEAKIKPINSGNDHSLK